MRRIVVAVDFSEHSTNIINYALKLAKMNNAEIMLFHTIIKPYYFSSPSIPEVFEYNQLNQNDIIVDARSTAINKINDLIKGLDEKSEANVKIFSKITEGVFEEDLEDFCSDYFPSLIIIGSKGIDESNFLFGNRTISVFNKSKFPVIAIPLIELNTCINNVLYIADLEISNSVLIRKTYNLFEICDPKVFCVHLTEDCNYLKAYSSKEYLNSAFETEITLNKFHCDVLEGEDKHEEIDNYIKKNNIDLIVFMPHKANFFQRLIGKNKSKNYLFETKLPIMAIRQ